MNARAVSLLICLLVGFVLSCKKPDEPVSGNTNTTPTSMVGTWKVSALTFDPAWSKAVNGTTERYTDYVQYLRRINETCLTDVVWTFTDGGGLATNMSTLSSCGARGPNSTFIVDYLVEARATYVETASQVNIRGTANQTNLVVTKTFAPDGLVSLQWKDARDISDNQIPTTYTLVLKKQ